ncbi:MAG: GIY-YIG nuclease family protein [Candidatus Taylorbacteria bacterium]
MAKPARRRAKAGLRLAEARLRRGKARTKKSESGEASLNPLYNAAHYIYSLKCKDGYYLGCTVDLKSRLKRHEKGQVPATASRLPVKLDFYFATPNKYQAFEFEKYLKSGSGRAFINKHLQ